MQSLRTVFVLSAASAAVCAATASADIVPISRTTSISAGWYLVGAPAPFDHGNSSDGSTSLGTYTNTVSSQSANASQTSYLFDGGAFASTSATGYSNHSFNMAYRATGGSDFEYVFQLSAPAMLSIIGTLTRSSAMYVDGVSYVRLYDDVTNTQLYQQGFLGAPQTTRTFADTYAAAPGRYRFVVETNSGGMTENGYSASTSAQAMLTIPAPGAASLFAFGAIIARRRR